MLGEKNEGKRICERIKILSNVFGRGHICLLHKWGYMWFCGAKKCLDCFSVILTLLEEEPYLKSIIRLKHVQKMIEKFLNFNCTPFVHLHDINSHKNHSQTHNIPSVKSAYIVDFTLFL